ncbi:site-specific recombinase XerD [Rhodococcus sp. PvR044]|uniref:tyrosine-type recombinase/integrase n=1 Tax=Rhodococcus sp. PvR044 TaxID=3156402 RepID=UPI003394501B
MGESLVSLQQSFNRSLRVEGKAPRTIELYGMSVEFLAAWLTSQGKPADVDSLTRDSVLGWLDHLRAKGLADGTVRTRWRGLRRFTGWCLAEEIIDADPLAGITVKNPAPPSVPVLTDEDLRKLIATCKPKSFQNRRDEALIRLLLDCGLRVSELTGITLDKLDLNAATVLVEGKGSKIRAAYFGDKTGEALDRYLRERAKHRHAQAAGLFLGERGALTPDGVREVLKVRAAAAGLEGKLNPHRFRHTFAHDFLMAGGQERDLKRLAGWTSDAMLERYGASAADVRAREAAIRLKRGDRI